MLGQQLVADVMKVTDQRYVAAARIEQLTKRYDAQLLVSGRSSRVPEERVSDAQWAVGRLLALAYPDRLAGALRHDFYAGR